MKEEKARFLRARTRGFSHERCIEESARFTRIQRLKNALHEVQILWVNSAKLRVDVASFLPEAASCLKERQLKLALEERHLKKELSSILQI